MKTAVACALIIVGLGFAAYSQDAQLSELAKQSVSELAGGNKDYKVVALPGLNHLFQTCKTGSVAEYSQIEETISPIALDLIGSWILERVK
jgi:hypothetical protein